MAVPVGTLQTALPPPGTCLRCLHLVREAASSSIDTLLDMSALADQWQSAACALATLCSFAAQVADSGELSERVLDFRSLRQAGSTAPLTGTLSCRARSTLHVHSPLHAQPARLLHL